MRLKVTLLFLISAISFCNGALPVPGKAGACGIWTSERIFGGVATAIDEFPWMALLEYKLSNGKMAFGCGGSLIDEKHVITAAHCIIDGIELKSVRLGEWNTSSPIDCGDPDDCTDPPQDIRVVKTFKHPKYNDDGINEYNDIAILRLEKPVTYSYFIKPICLPTDVELKSLTDFSGTKFIVAGWGRTETKAQSDVKVKASIDGISKTACSPKYQKLGRTLTDNQICAGGKDIKDSCQGDSGGPLMALYKKGKINYMYLAGIVSYGPAMCGTSGIPGIYTRTSAYIDWINETLQKP